MTTSKCDRNLVPASALDRDAAAGSDMEALRAEQRAECAVLAWRSTFRGRITRGAVFLVMRQSVAAATSLVGIVLVARWIGAEQYGYFIGAIGLLNYCQGLCLSGVDVYLIRREGGVEVEDYHQAFSLLLVLSVAAAAMAIGLVPLYARWSPEAAPVVVVATWLFAGLPLVILGHVPGAWMERHLEFGKVAAAGTLAQLTYTLVSVTLAWRGFGAFALLIGWWASALLSVALNFGLAGYAPRWLWRWDRVRAIGSYGVSYSASMWVWQLRLLANTLVVGKFLGPAAMGQVGLALNLLERLSFVKAATWRLSLAGLAKLQNDQSRLVRAVAEGMQLQVLALGAAVAAFGILAPFLLPRLFGADFGPVLQLFPFLAAATMASALFSLHSAALYVVRRNWDVTAFHSAHVAILFAMSGVLVPRLGVIGYGWAELAATSSYMVIHWFTAYRIGTPDYRLAAVWATGFGLVAFWPQLHWWALAGLPVIAAFPDTWKVLGEYSRGLRSVAYA